MKRLLFILLLITSFHFDVQGQVIVNGWRYAAPSFKPTDISDIQLWLAADSITGLADTDPISTWPDKSGNGNDATQSGSNRPTFKTADLNGKPVVDFVYGSAQYFVLTNPIPVTTDLTFFFVYKKTASSTLTPIAGATTDANGYPSLYEWSDNYGYFGFNGNNVSYALTNLNGVYGYITLQSESGLDSVWRNGVNITVNTFAVATSTVSLQHIGRVGSGGQYSLGQIAEIIVYDRKITTVERQQVESYIATKYAL